MPLKNNQSIRLCILLGSLVLLFLSSCSRPLTWPDSPLYEFPAHNTDWIAPQTRQMAMEAIAGRYAHYDVVSYEDQSTRTPMLTYVISYGFTDFYIQDGKLFQIDQYCQADHAINQPFVTSSFSNAATQAIQPVPQEVELEFRNGTWHLFRPATPTLLGIDGDPNLPLSRDPNDPNLTDPDGDGNPGVTVNLTIAGFIKGEIYITRREIYRNHLSLHSDGNLYGWVEDDSEQFVIDASMAILRQPSSSVQIPDPGMNPLFLIRVDDSMACSDLAELRTQLFPPVPQFVPVRR